MNRVRKDILNGWKEIGGYVCRDIRTVERWEKHRGLPVRRVPGTGRATVYALISEVDEWLASAKEEGAEDVPEPIALHFVSPASVEAAAPDPASSQSFEAEAVAVDNPPEEPLPQPLVIMPTVQTGAETRRSWMGGVVVAAAIVLLTAAVWPLMVQARHETSAAGAAHGEHPAADPDAVRAAPSIPYRSNVPGVDDLYLSGVYSYEQRTPAALKHSLQDFTDAIAKDPNYAPAYAGLANTYNLLREYSGMSDSEAYPKAKAAAERAIALDPRLPQAHASLGFVDFFWAWDPVAAEREFKAALALDPASVLAHHWYGSMLTHEGRYAEAIQELDIAQRLQPTSAAIVSLRALAMGESGHRDEAVAMLEEILKEAPSATSPHNVLGTLSLMEPHDIPRYLSETRRVAELRHDQSWLQINAVGERAYRQGGEHAMWASMLEAEKRAHPEASAKTFSMAQEEYLLGHTDAAIAILRDLIDEHNPMIMGILNDPTMRPLRQDPRYRQILTRIGLPVSLDNGGNNSSQNTAVVLAKPEPARFGNSSLQ
jgi:tetratricopeptide (TPR) repeat protein